MTEKAKPDSQKSALEKASETVTGYADQVMASLQSGNKHPLCPPAAHATLPPPCLYCRALGCLGSDKSATQKLADSTRIGAGDTQKEAGGLADTIGKNAAAAKDSVVETVSGLTGSASNTASGEV